MQGFQPKGPPGFYPYVFVLDEMRRRLLIERDWLAKETRWSELVPFMASRGMRFEVVDEDGWTSRLTELINES